MCSNHDQESESIGGIKSIPKVGLSVNEAGKDEIWSGFPGSADSPVIERCSIGGAKAEIFIRLQCSAQRMPRRRPERVALWRR